MPNDASVKTKLYRDSRKPQKLFPRPSVESHYGWLLRSHHFALSRPYCAVYPDAIGANLKVEHSEHRGGSLLACLL